MTPAGQFRPPAAEAVAAALDRIAEVDPMIRSVCTLDPDARAVAARLDAERADGHDRGPLHGVPVLVKDNIDTAGLATTAGSLALADVPPPERDAPLVRRLRAAGCVLLGKTNLSEWANFRGSASTSGWSGYGGLTRNPYALNRSAGGSSSGSGAAVAAGLAPLAIGTETNGSIVCPAANNGVVGIKPTVGLVPRQGIVPISHSQDTAGPMAPTVRAAAALLSVIADGDTDFTRNCDDDGLAGARIGVPRGSLWGYSRGLDDATERALDLIAAAGATIVDDLVLPVTRDEDQLIVLCHELKATLPAYLATRHESAPKTLADLIEFNRAHAGLELRWFGQDLFERAERCDGLDSPSYLAARQAGVRSGGEGIDGLLREHRLDALVTPGYPPAWTIDLVNGDHVTGGSSTHAALAGYPLVSVPSGLVEGLPVAITFSGTADSDATLIRLAHGYETARTKADGPFPPPEFTRWL